MKDTNYKDQETLEDSCVEESHREDVERLLDQIERLDHTCRILNLELERGQDMKRMALISFLFATLHYFQNQIEPSPALKDLWVSEVKRSCIFAMLLALYQEMDVHLSEVGGTPEFIEKAIRNCSSFHERIQKRLRSIRTN